MSNSEHFARHRSLEFAALTAGGLAGLTGALFQLGTGRIALEKDRLANIMASDAFVGWVWPV